LPLGSAEIVETKAHKGLHQAESFRTHNLCVECGANEYKNTNKNCTCLKMLGKKILQVFPMCVQGQYFTMTISELLLIKTPNLKMLI
jgi:hypothetical protein